jgi:hypothetical protein
MQNSLKNKDLVHKFENSLVFSDNSINLNDYLRNDTELKLGPSDIWYIGYTKPLQQFYVEFQDAKISDQAIVIEFWNGTGWEAVPNKFDDSQDFTRSAFITFEFNDLQKVKDVWQTNTVDGDQIYWIRITSASNIFSSILSATGVGNTDTILQIAEEDISNYSAGQEIYVADVDEYAVIDSVGATDITLTAALSAAPADNTNINRLVNIKGFNILYCDEEDLVAANPRIRDFLFRGQENFLNYRVEVQKDIVQTLRTGGWKKILQSRSETIPNTERAIGRFRQMTKWDFLDIREIREAAKYLTLAKIFFEVSENVEDKAFSRYRGYSGKYGEAFKNFYMSLDLDDDGETDTSDNMIINSIDVVKI